MISSLEINDCVTSHTRKFDDVLIYQTSHHISHDSLHHLCHFSMAFPWFSGGFPTPGRLVRNAPHVRYSTSVGCRPGAKTHHFLTMEWNSHGFPEGSHPQNRRQGDVSLQSSTGAGHLLGRNFGQKKVTLLM